MPITTTMTTIRCIITFAPRSATPCRSSEKTEAAYEDAQKDDGENGWAEPWFYCVCGGPFCHSSLERGGFRGFEYFSLEEQKSLCASCEPWVLQQFSWKLHLLKTQQQPREDGEQEFKEQQQHENGEHENGEGTTGPEFGTANSKASSACFVVYDDEEPKT